MFNSDYVDLRKLSNGSYILLEELIYQGRDEIFIVPKGMITDLASVPRFLRWLVGPADRNIIKAALVHDFLWAESRAGRFRKCHADGIFRRIMRESGVGVAQRWFMWATVRLAGGPSNWFDDGFKQFVLFMSLAVVGILFAAIPCIVVLLFFAVALWVSFFAEVISCALFILRKS